MSPNNPLDQVVRLVTAKNPVHAHMVQQALQEEGIQCQVVGDYLDAGIGDIPGFNAEVWVHGRDLARAEAVLQAMPDTSDEETADEPET